MWLRWLNTMIKSSDQNTESLCWDLSWISWWQWLMFSTLKAWIAQEVTPPLWTSEVNELIVSGLEFVKVAREKPFQEYNEDASQCHYIQQTEVNTLTGQFSEMQIYTLTSGDKTHQNSRHHDCSHTNKTNAQVSHEICLEHVRVIFLWPKLTER